MGIWWRSRVSGSARGSVSTAQTLGYLVAPARLRRALPRESGHLPQRTRTARPAHVHLVARGESYTVRFRAYAQVSPWVFGGAPGRRPEGDVGCIAEEG